MASPLPSSHPTKVYTPSGSLERRSGALFWLVLLLLLGIGRILATYPELTQTVDEADHIAAGMGWLQGEPYVRTAEHPPLARIAVALGPYLDGARAGGKPDNWEEGNAILHTNDRYLRTLSLARAGILPFFILATLVLWHWTRVLFGTPAALAATLLFTTLPPVLAHAGLATTDLPLTATLLAALYAFDRWLTAPTWGRALVLGLCGGVALATKLSALLFMPVCGAPLLLLRLHASQRDHAPFAVPLSRTLGLFGLSLLVAALTLWGFYRFSLSETGLPAPELLKGISFIAIHDRTGHLTYLLGEVSTQGHWYFFPLALLVKTPPAFLALLLAGLILLIGRVRQGATPLLLAPALVALALFVSVLPVNINIGLRHILPIFPFLAMLAGLGAALLWEARAQQVPKRILLAALIGGQLYSSITSHPDYLPYFNILAGKHPEQVLVDSDLDWGQDLDRLSRELKELRVPEISLCYFGSADLGRHGLPPWKQLQPFQPTSGWLAISSLCYALGNFIPPYTGYRWLDAYTPIRQIGHSIRLYYLPPNESPTQQASPPPP